MSIKDRENIELTAAGAEKWARKPSWTHNEAIRLARNIDPTLFKKFRKFRSEADPAVQIDKNDVLEISDRIINKKPNLPEALKRAYRAELIAQHPTPVDFIKFLDEIRYPVPDHLRAAVVSVHSNAIFLKKECERLQSNITEKIEEIEKLRKMAEAKDYRNQEKKNLYKFVAAWACTLGFVPDGSDTRTVTNLYETIKNTGLKINRDTIKTYVEDAYSLHGEDIRTEKEKQKKYSVL